MDKKEELYFQSMISQLVKIEKDMRGIQETSLCELLSMVEMNRLTLKTLQVQFNVFIENKERINPLEKEIDEEIIKLKERVNKYKDSIKDVSGTLGLPAPDGKGEIIENE